MNGLFGGGLFGPLARRTPVTTAAATTTGPAALATSLDAPAEMLRLPQGTVLNARVVDVSDKGHLVLKTPAGPLTVRSSLPLPEGTAMTLLMTGSTGQTARFRLTAIEGKPLAQWVQDVPAQPTGTPQTLFVGPRAPILHATVLQRGMGMLNVGGVPDVGGMPDVGTVLSLRLTGIGSSLASKPAPPSTLGAKVASALSTVTYTIAQHLREMTLPPPSTQRSSGFWAASTRPSGASSQAGVSSFSIVGQTLTGTVIGNSAAGATVVQGSMGLLAFPGGMDVPPGTPLTMSVLAAGMPTVPSAPLSAGMPFPTGSAWPAMSETLTLLNDANPQAAQQLAAVIPSTDVRMVANAVAYTQAVRHNDVTRWVPQNVIRALEKSGKKGQNLLHRLRDDLREVGDSCEDGAWRTLPMPFMDGGALTQITIVTRRLEAESDAKEGPGKGQQGQGQRFLINVSFSKFGDIQFDGLYKGKDRSFDLIIRSRSELPQTIRQTIHGLFVRSSEGVATTGGIAFYVTDRFSGPPPAEGGWPSTIPTAGPAENAGRPIGPSIPRRGWTA